jgi:flagella basal body P-ring formation protein FlgA
MQKTARRFRKEKATLLVFLALSLFFVATLFVFAAQAETTVTLRPAVEVKRAAIRLADVFAGLPEGIDRDIATAPAPGKSVTYDVHVLSKLAEQYRLDWQPQNLADCAVLTRASTRITQDMIREAVAGKLKALDIKGKTEIQFDNRNLEVNLPADQLPVFTLEKFEYDALSKHFRGDLAAKSGATPFALPVTGRVIVQRDIPVLARHLDGGATIGEADLDWITVSDEHVTGDVVTETSQIIGRELRHAITEGQPLHGRDFIPPRLVTRGSLVLLKIETPYLLMTAQGRALQDGAAGESVRVTNTQSNRVVEGIAEAPGVVRIRMARQIASVE